MSVPSTRRRASLRDVEPGRLGCTPGTSRVVLDALMAPEQPAQPEPQPDPYATLKTAVWQVGVVARAYNAWADAIEDEIAELLALAPLTVKAVAL